jgi:hypothetical protein
MPVFSHGVPATFLRERDAGNLTSHTCKVLVVHITAFLCSVVELVSCPVRREQQLWGGNGGKCPASVHHKEAGLLAPSK